MGMRKTEIDAGAGFDYYYGTEAEQFAFYREILTAGGTGTPHMRKYRRIW